MRRSDALLRLGHAMLAAPGVEDPVAVRAATLLARRALEREIAERLARDLPGAERGTFRAQLLCLRAVTPRTGATTSQLHGELSHACHHHPYELAPTVDEARELVERTSAAVRELASEGAPPATRPPARRSGA